MKKRNFRNAGWRVAAAVLAVCAMLLTGCSAKDASAGARFTADMDAFAANFRYKDYEEVIGAKKTHVMAIPETAAQIDADADQYYSRQKAFVYRGVADGAIILLEITATDAKDEWSHSMVYLPQLFNADGATYSAQKNERLPETSAAVESFVYGGYSYQIMCVAGSAETDAGAICVDFCNELVKYLKP